MQTVRMTTAQALVKFLNQQYVEFDGKQQKFIKGIFTIFGHGNVVGPRSSFRRRRRGIRSISRRNEQGMANAAMAFAKQKTQKTNYGMYFFCWSWISKYDYLCCNSFCNVFPFYYFQVMYLQQDNLILFFNKLNKHMTYLFLRMMLFVR